MKTIFGLVNLQVLSMLSYIKRRSELLEFLKGLDIIGFYENAILENDRVIMFQYKGAIILSVAGSDDRQDWKENVIIRTVKRLWYAYKGFGLPAEAIYSEIKNYCKSWNLDINKVVIEQSSHSRGGAITAILHSILTKNGLKSQSFTWGEACPGGRRFKNRCQTNSLYGFEIKGDPVPKSNPFGKHIGNRIKLPKQIKGFFHRIGGLFKGNMNHRSYNCIKDITPYCNW